WADLKLRLLTDFDTAFRDLADVGCRVANFNGLQYLKEAARCAYDALVADLAALLGVEAGLIQEQTNFCFWETACGMVPVVSSPAENAALASRAEPFGPIIRCRQPTGDVNCDLGHFGSDWRRKLYPKLLITFLVKLQAALLRHLPR